MTNRTKHIRYRFDDVLIFMKEIARAKEKWAGNQSISKVISYKIITFLISQKLFYSRGGREEEEEGRGRERGRGKGRLSFEDVIW